jgi:hypothetical protein
MKITNKLQELAFHSKLVKGLLEEGTLVIDNSSFEALTQCDVKGFLEVFLKRKTTRNAAPLIYGGAFHEAMEVFYKGSTEEQAIEAGLAKAEVDHLDSLEDAKRNTSSLKELLRFYFMDEKLAKHDLRPIVINSEPFVEKSFSFFLGDITLDYGGTSHLVRVLWSGKIDLAVDKSDGTYGLDHKTTSVMGAQFADDKLRSSQMLGYAWALVQSLKALGCKKSFKGMLINAVCQRSRGFERQVFILPYTQWQIDEWQLETLVILQTTLARILKTLSNSFLCPCRTSCVTKYGKCAHFETCQYAPEPMASVVLDETFYKDDNWSPLGEE